MGTSIYKSKSRTQVVRIDYDFLKDRCVLQSVLQSRNTIFLVTIRVYYFNGINHISRSTRKI